MTVLHLWLTPYLEALFPQDNGELGLKVPVKLMDGVEHIWAQPSSGRALAIRHQGMIAFTFYFTKIKTLHRVCTAGR